MKCLFLCGDFYFIIPKSCPKCDLFPLENGCDPCLGMLPGVIGACCGHGVHQGYLWFENGIRIFLNNKENK